MDLNLHDDKVKISGDEFSKRAHGFREHVRRQVTLQREMDRNLPKSMKRWAQLLGQIQYLLTHRARMIVWVEYLQHTSSLTVMSWIIADAINSLFNLCS